MRIALLSYHKNINEIYPSKWIEQYRDSIQDQTYQEFEIFELNYGGGNERIFQHSYFESHSYPSFIDALNYLLDKVFSSGYDVAVNQNCDDWYRGDFVERLLVDMNKGYDLVSCNFCLVKDDRIFKYHRFDHLDIEAELDRGHNIIAHPACCYSRSFWEENRYNPYEFPTEDLELWKRAIKSGSKFYINPENLLFHRIHNQSVCQSSNR